jgi:hypothetical protein
MRLAAPRAPPAGCRSLSDKVADMRLDHGGGGLQLSERTAGDAPLPLFERWFAAASRHPGVVEPNAMALSTVAPSGQPSCRVVLLKATARPLTCGRHHKEIASETNDSRGNRHAAVRRPREMTDRSDVAHHKEIVA